MLRMHRGMSYVEILVAAAILITLAGVVVPVVSISRMDDRHHDVHADLEGLTQAITRYVADTRTFPTGHAGATSYHFLFTDGMRPDNNVYASGPGAHVDQFLVAPQFVADGFRGPYVTRKIGPDPWGRAYLVNVNGFFSSGERVLVISAGPNGQINTPPSATVASGDDIVLVIE